MLLIGTAIAVSTCINYGTNCGNSYSACERAGSERFLWLLSTLVSFRIPPPSFTLPILCVPTMKESLLSLSPPDQEKRGGGGGFHYFLSSSSSSFTSALCVCAGRQRALSQMKNPITRSNKEGGGGGRHGEQGFLLLLKVEKREREKNRFFFLGMGQQCVPQVIFFLAGWPLS